MTKRKMKLLVIVLTGLLTYPASYILLRSTKFLVRREWLEIHPHSLTHQREIYASDVGYGSHFDAHFKPKKDSFCTLFFPLWQTELRLRGNYFYHDEIVVIHVDLLESDQPTNPSNH